MDEPKEIPKEFLGAVKVDNHELSLDEDDEIDIKPEQPSAHVFSEVS